MPDAFAVRRELLGTVGGFDEVRFPFHYDEADLGMRIRELGLLTMVVPAAAAWHSGGTSADPGLEMVRAYQLSGKRRVELMIYARVVFHGLHSSGPQRLLALGVFVPVYVIIAAIASLRSANAAFRLSLLAAMLRGLRQGYEHVLRQGRPISPRTNID
jgi:GT2 family glycosyltransferase